MFGSPILDVAIGMVFFYLLLSLICSAANEMIEAWLKNRSNDLENGIRRLLADPDPNPTHFWKNVGRRLLGLFNFHGPRTPTGGLASKLYSHGLVRCLYPNERNLPAYIPARTFALAMMDILAPGEGSAGATQTAATVSPPPADGFYAAVQQAQIDARVREALIALIQAAGNDAVRVRENLEGWYNSTMDRVSGWYKRRTQIIILTLGIGISAALNADTMVVLEALWKNAALRTSVANSAVALGGQVQQKTAAGVLDSLQLPLGWNGGSSGSDERFTPPRHLRAGLALLRLHWLGWLLTGFAISLGAPFWFDLLNKFVVVRSTVKPEEKSRIEPSKD